jgi:hypothetical protein
MRAFGGEHWLCPSKDSPMQIAISLAGIAVMAAAATAMT